MGASTLVGTCFATYWRLRVDGAEPAAVEASEALVELIVVSSSGLLRTADCSTIRELTRPAFDNKMRPGSLLMPQTDAFGQSSKVALCVSV
jgi:hypothetical protein